MYYLMCDAIPREKSYFKLSSTLVYFRKLFKNHPILEQC